MPQREFHAHRIEPPQPRAQQWRCLEGLRKHPAAGTDEGRLPQRFAPGAQRIRRECLYCRREMRHRCAISLQKFRQRFTVGEIESAAPRHQELAACRRHRVVDGHVGAALRQHLSRHQPGGTGADDGDVLRHGVTASRPLSPRPARHISASAGTRPPALSPSTCRRSRQNARRWRPGSSRLRRD